MIDLSVTSTPYALQHSDNWRSRYLDPGPDLFKKRAALQRFLLPLEATPELPMLSVHLRNKIAPALPFAAIVAESKSWIIGATIALIGMLIAWAVGTSAVSLLAGIAVAISGASVVLLIRAARHASLIAAACYVVAGALLFFELIELFASLSR